MFAFVDRSSKDRHGEGVATGEYLAAIGWLQILAGVFQIFFSAMGFLHFGLQEPELASLPGSENPAQLDSGYAFGLLPGNGALALYVAAQIAVGWILGLLTLWAGFETRRAARRRFIRAVALANLPLAPLGTTIGAIALFALGRPETRAYFASKKRSLAP